MGTPDVHAARLVGMIPNLVTRLGVLERQHVPQIKTQLDEHASMISEMRRMLGDEGAFSLKARRALAPDVPKGLAASSPQFDWDELEAAETSAQSVVSSDVRKRIEEICYFHWSRKTLETITIGSNSSAERTTIKSVTTVQ